MTKHAQRKRTRSAPPTTKATKTTATKKVAKKTVKAPRKTATPPAAKPKEPAPQRPRDPRIPPAGTTLIRPYKGREIRVVVLDAGFRWEGREYRSLSALAAKVTGAASINGPLWFRLTKPKPSTSKSRIAKPKSGTPKKAAQEPTPTTETPTV